ncbi:undecaprenyl-diphosphatase [Pedobacter cryoconitis]|uniref:Undecaprenyl-diphosphatase n=1 Tax=Pedobacter cryoconitis TaxID=188932 RepID=A0A7W8ZRU5_9SPHI|nr:phosphatase PAP2 family protein [Pedobacter cryoconitis]MBB5639042.1 undecaprenyl-diphosphatase [Pedobacter cryoconitis]
MENTLTSSKKRVLIWLLIILSLGFIFLTFIVTFFPPSAIDLKISAIVQSAQSPELDKIMTFISWFGAFPVPFFIGLFVAAIFYLFKFRTEAMFVLLTFTSGIISSVIKIIVNRPRPTSDLVRIVEVARQQSFPSGHTLFYVIFFGFLLTLMWRLKQINTAVRLTIATFSSFLILTIPFSRIYLGAHWFTDVLGGFILGLICLYFISVLYLKKA